MWKGTCYHLQSHYEKSHLCIIVYICHKTSTSTSLQWIRSSYSVKKPNVLTLLDADSSAVIWKFISWMHLMLVGLDDYFGELKRSSLFLTYVCSVKLHFLIICHLPQWDVSNFVTNRNLLCFRLESYSCKLVSHEKAFYKKFSRSVQAGMNEMEVLSPSKDDLATSPYGSIFTPFDIYNRFEKNQFSQTQLLNVVDIWSSV